MGMKLSLELVSEWLKNNLNKKILIRKQEKEDLDEVLLHLKLTEYRGERSNAIDNYISDSALLLHGNGSVITDGLEVELPSNTFEIPLNGIEQAEANKDTLSFKTERAQYLLTLQ
jgi:hypothetical protein